MQSLMHQVLTPRPVLVLVPAFRAQARPAFTASRGLRSLVPSASWSSWFSGSARKQVLRACLEHRLSAQPVQSC